MAAHDNPQAPLLGYPAPTRRQLLSALLLLLLLLLSAGIVALLLSTPGGSGEHGGVRGFGGEEEESIEAEHAVVAADDGRCSEIGASALRRGGHAVDAAVATAVCLGVVNPMSSGIGGGAFMVVRSSETGEAVAFDSRETAPLAASKNMYESNPSAKKTGALSAGVPGELAGLHAAWTRYGRLPWPSLLEPSIRLARDGFEVSQYLANGIAQKRDLILSDRGLRGVFAPDGRPLKAGDTCHNPALARALEAFATEGPEALYTGSVGEALVGDVQEAGGVLTMEDLRSYEVEVTEATKVDVMGYTLLGMPPPSSGTVGMAMILSILESYGDPDAAKGPLGLHRLVEAMKHMFAIRMGLGDPDFVNTTACVSKMLSPSFAERVRERISDTTTFAPGYYLPRWSQLRDHGTSHFCVVDADRNAVSMTSTVNSYFGAGVLSPSTGIVLNNEMDDFSTPTEITPDKLPPAPANFIEPRKRPLSSMTPIIVLKDNQLAGVVGGSGGLCIIPAVVQIFINHFVLRMGPLAAVQRPRVYHKLIPDELTYENLTAIDGEHIELSAEAISFLKQRGHNLKSATACSVSQLVVHDLRNPVRRSSRKIRRRGRESNEENVFYGMLTAVSDPRKDGAPSGM